MTIRDIITKLSGNKMANKQRKNTPRFNYRHPQQVAALNNLLDQFRDGLANGYSDDAWVQVGRSYRRLSGYLFPTEREVLASAWRTCYVDHNVEAVRAAVDEVRSRL